MSTVAALPQPVRYLYRPAPVLSNDGTKWEASIAFVVPQVSLIDFITIVGGVSENVPVSFGTMRRIVTLQHPLYPALYAKRIRCEMFGEASKTSTALPDLHSHVKVVVDFEALPFGITGDEAYMTKTARGSSLYTTIPNRKLTFSTGEVLGQDAGQIVGRTSYEFTLFQCATTNETVVEAAVGKINNATLLGRTAGKLLFESWEYDIEVLIGGVTHITKKLVLTYQSHSWNQFFRSDGVLDTATDPAGNPVYESTNLALIFE